ncbi:unnamed protein product, partial [Lymnaea stagnalis]
MLVVALAFCDLLCCSMVMPLGVIEVFENGKWNFGAEVCGMRSVLNDYIQCASIYHVTCMAVDRYLAVCKPFVHRLLTNKAGYLMIAVSLIVPASLVGINTIISLTGDRYGSFWSNNVQYFVWVIAFYAPFFVSYILYLLILIEAQRQTTLPHIKPVVTSSAIKNMKAYHTLGCLIICYTICWLPGWLTIFFEDQSSGHIFILLSWLTYVNTVLNPLL